MKKIFYFMLFMHCFMSLQGAEKKNPYSQKSLARSQALFVELFSKKTDNPQSVKHLTKIYFRILQNLKPRDTEQFSQQLQQSAGLFEEVAYFSAEQGHTLFFKELIKNYDHKKLNAQSTAAPLLVRISQFDCNKEIQLLLAKKADPNIVDHQGWTPLHKAAFYGQENLVPILAAAGANPNQITSCLASPLHFAIQGDHANVVQPLLDAKANPEIMRLCPDGMLTLAPLEMAKNFNRHAILKIFEQAGFRPEEIGTDQIEFCNSENSDVLSSALHDVAHKIAACMLAFPKPDIIKIAQLTQALQDILENKLADSNQKDKDGLTYKDILAYKHLNRPLTQDEQQSVNYPPPQEVALKKAPGRGCKEVASPSVLNP
jgi:Ankyrin repeats (3 copies)